MDYFIFMAVSLFLVQSNAAYSRENPRISCRNMIPDYGVEPQTSSSPYTVFVAPDTYHPDKPMEVSLIGIGSKAMFTGFLLQARQVNSERLCGTFLVPEHQAGVQLRSCQRTDDTATNAQCFKASTVTVTWYPPLHNYGLIAFNATVIKNRTTFWTGITSTKELKPAHDFMHYGGVLPNGTYPHNHSEPWVWLEEYHKMATTTSGAAARVWLSLVFMFTALIVCL